MKELTENKLNETLEPLNEAVAFNKGYQQGANDTKDMKWVFIWWAVMIPIIAGLLFKFVVVPAADNFLYNKVQYVPFCPDDPQDIPEGLELMGEAELL